jgi:hypothetical protein
MNDTVSTTESWIRREDYHKYGVINDFKGGVHGMCWYYSIIHLEGLTRTVKS